MDARIMHKKFQINRTSGFLLNNFLNVGLFRFGWEKFACFFCPRAVPCRPNNFFGNLFWILSYTFYSIFLLQPFNLCHQSYTFYATYWKDCSKLYLKCPNCWFNTGQRWLTLTLIDEGWLFNRRITNFREKTKELSFSPTFKLVQPRFLGGGQGALLPRAPHSHSI